MSTTRVSVPSLVGQLVRLRPERWRDHASNWWGRAMGVGLVIAPPFDLDSGECEVAWPSGRCFELVRELEVVAPSSTGTGGVPAPAHPSTYSRKASARWRALRDWYALWSWARTEAGLPGAESPSGRRSELARDWRARANGLELTVEKGAVPIWTFVGPPRQPRDEELLEFSRRFGSRFRKRCRTKRRQRLGGERTRALVENELNTRWRERLDRTSPLPLSPAGA